MEYGMNSTLKITLKDLNAEIVESIEFVFKQISKHDAPAIKHATWRRGTKTEDVYTIDDDYVHYYIPFSKDDTFLFEPGKKFFMDARIHYADTFDNPEVPVVSIMMDTGLFGKEDDYE